MRKFLIILLVVTFFTSCTTYYSSVSPIDGRGKMYYSNQKKKNKKNVGCGWDN